MEIQEAIKILKKHNEWRRYNGDMLKSPAMPHPTEIGIAIDTVVASVQTFNDVISKFMNIYIINVDENGSPKASITDIMKLIDAAISIQGKYETK